ncbi:hypothetical protein [Roseofilum sp. Guam]|uniref:hypothetical protein n=1 Tax=Roseofilum sp. Guam TaxID=2821502 RepID=UPI001B102FDC|nr:hypothetical protein [Roseofilum sp. Guam]MBP0026958.1 hypothetical protein [Roseofilum sp. Guam]
MLTYEDWNRALADYFLQGVARGTRVYLSVDDTVLDLIAQQYFSIQPCKRSWYEDFIAVVRDRVVKGDRIMLERIEGNDSARIPNCVAFLGICVLAAYNMATDEDITDTNYFKRLRAVLQLPTFDDAPHLKETSPRPRGMEAGKEEPLWKTWNKWLLKKDYLPSARAGSSRRKKYTNYPISQCLLRHGDCDRLERYFYEQQWTSSVDAQTLFSRLRGNNLTFPEYLRNLIKKPGERYEVLMDAIHQLHQQWVEDGCPEPDRSTQQRKPSSTLFAGLYRSEEDDEIEYYLYPKQQRGQSYEEIQVQFQGEQQELESDRPGWYLPLGSPLTSQDLNRGIRCPITQSEFLKTLQLPTRDFWLLVPDPDDPDTGVYGSWGTPELGTPFILLCKQSLLKDLNHLKNEQLVNWEEQSFAFGEEQDWQELSNFMVLSQAWDAVFINNWELKDALQPKVSLSISFSGGLRAPHQKSWLSGYPPQITVFGFMPEVDLEIFRWPDEQCIAEPKTLLTNQPQELYLPDQGTYLIRASSNSDIREQMIKIISWDDLELNPNVQNQASPIIFYSDDLP